MDEELGLTWCDEASDSNRHLVNVVWHSLLVRTSRYARFADDVLPIRSGYVEGILGWFNNSYQLRVIDARNVIMESPRFWDNIPMRIWIKRIERKKQKRV